MSKPHFTKPLKIEAHLVSQGPPYVLTTSVHLGPFPKNLINLFQKAPLARAETRKKQDFQLRQWRVEFRLCRRLQRERTASLTSRAAVLACWITLLDHTPGAS